jgi:AcrR family transcriptional regulator
MACHVVREADIRTRRRDSAGTRERLIRAASEVFAKKNYNAATIAEICNLAKANRAAVNYHFRDKETLYREAWRYAFRKSIAVYPADGGVGDDALPEERLRGSIMALLHRITDENDREFLIVQREMSNPTGLLEEVIDTELVPIHERMREIVRELLGSACSSERALYCVVSIMNQCLHPMLKEPQHADAEKSRRPRLDMPAFIDHVIEFSLGGIRAIAGAAQKPATAIQAPH